MIYVNKDNNRQYKFTDKIGGPVEKIAQVEVLDTMSDYDRDKHLMWLTHHKYLLMA